MRFLLLKNKKVIDLESKQVSSWNYIDKSKIEEYGIEEPCYEVYYFNRDIGEHIEQDDKGGQSMDSWYLDGIVAQADTIEELCDEFYLEWNIDEYPYSPIRQHERFGGFGDLKRDIRDRTIYGYTLNKVASGPTKALSTSRK